jgi:hypothetical protein
MIWNITQSGADRDQREQEWEAAKLVVQQHELNGASV